jgi:hypothetical protein
MRSQTHDCVKKILARLRSAAIDINSEAHKGNREREFAFALMIDLAKIDKLINDVANNDQKLAEIEHDSLRPIALDLRRYFLRHHLMLIRPLWGWSTPAQKETGAANTVVFVGRTETEKLVRNVCSRRNLKLSAESVGFGGGQRRWNDLREANLGVFDLSGTDSQLQASVSHSLGAALVLGVFPLVIRDDETPLPFDIDIKPIPFASGAIGFESGLEDGICASYTASGHSSVRATLSYLLDEILEDEFAVQEVRKSMENIVHPDPIEVRAIGEQLLALQQRHDVGLVTPVWPALYPNMKQPKCFHVMPFSLGWSNEIRECVRLACEHNGIAYVRGDETEEQRIIFSIWQELSSATHIVVELGCDTDAIASSVQKHRIRLNANVALELGIAQALGRNCLLVHRGRVLDNSLFPEIDRLQVRTYDSNVELTGLVTKFLQSKTD